MTKREYIYTIVFVAVSLPLMYSCSDDSEAEGERVMVELQPCAQSFVEVSPISTRAWTPPTGYYSYESMNNMFSGQTDLINKTIGIFFTQDDKSPEEGRFFYGSDGKWRATVQIKVATYYLYGFIPYESGVSASVSGTYSSGATLALNGLPTVTPSDVCVVVGAKNDTSEDDDNELKTGQFEYKAASTSSDNFIFLLFDHLYSALNIKVSVGADYYALRRIKLKEMTLVPYSGGTVFSNKANVTVTLASNTNGASPITGVTYAPTGSDDEPLPIFQSVDGQELQTTSTPIRGCFTPQGITKFILKSTYDVYDRKDNLIREGCTAENTIDMTKLFPSTTQMQRGTMYTLNMTVEPTYLYVLSDPDLDNPTLVIE